MAGQLGQHPEWLAPAAQSWGDAGEAQAGAKTDQGAGPGAGSTPEAAELGRCVRKIQLGCFGGSVGVPQSSDGRGDHYMKDSLRHDLIPTEDTTA